VIKDDEGEEIGQTVRPERALAFVTFWGLGGNNFPLCGLLRATLQRSPAVTGYGESLP